MTQPKIILFEMSLLRCQFWPEINHLHVTIQSISDQEVPPSGQDVTVLILLETLVGQHLGSEVWVKETNCITSEMDPKKQKLERIHISFHYLLKLARKCKFLEDAISFVWSVSTINSA